MSFEGERRGAEGRINEKVAKDDDEEEYRKRKPTKEDTCDRFWDGGVGNGGLVLVGLV